jgi:hypothetical protein
MVVDGNGNGNNFSLLLMSSNIPTSELKTYERQDLLMANERFIIFKDQIWSYFGIGTNNSENYIRIDLKGRTFTSDDHFDLMPNYLVINNQELLRELQTKFEYLDETDEIVFKNDSYLVTNTKLFFKG